MTNGPDDDWEQIGPLRYRHRVGDDGKGVTDWRIEGKPGVLYQLDEFYGEAIAAGIRACPEGMFTVRESDAEKRSSGDERGWLRLRASSDQKRFGDKAARPNTVFQVARLVANPGDCQRPERPDPNAWLDYRRDAFVMGDDAPNRQDTRSAFNRFCSERGADGKELERLFAKADDYHGPGEIVASVEFPTR